MSDYITPLDWADVTPGMVVELRHGKYPAVVGEVERRDIGWVLVNGFWLYAGDGWSLFVKPEPAEPDPLPTEPGWYLDEEDDAWELDEFGQWTHAGIKRQISTARQFAPFSRLLTEAEWEAKQGEPYAELITTLRLQANFHESLRQHQATVNTMRRAADALANTPEGSKP